jgi:hypothetical protein
MPTLRGADARGCSRLRGAVSARADLHCGCVQVCDEAHCGGDEMEEVRDERGERRSSQMSLCASARRRVMTRR